MNTKENLILIFSKNVNLRTWRGLNSEVETELLNMDRQSRKYFCRKKLLNEGFGDLVNKGVSFCLTGKICCL